MVHRAMTIGTALVNPSASTRRGRRCSTTRRASGIYRRMRSSKCWPRRPEAGSWTSAPVPGPTLSSSREARPDLEVIALDEQQAMLDLLGAKPAAQKLPNLVLVHTDEITKLNGTADRVLAINVLHELGDEALRALVGLLKPNGTVLAVDWNAGVDRPVGPPRDHVYTATEARERMETAGLHIEGERMFKYHYTLVARRV